MTKVTEPAWLVEARRHIGVREIKGPKHNSVIVGWLRTLKAWWLDDETPWCGVFVAHCIAITGYKLPKHWYRAKGWLDWGVAISDPVVGAIVIFAREGGGHVAIVVGRDAAGNLMCIGGNQGDMVKISPFSTLRVQGYRIPQDMKLPALPRPLPLIASTGQVSSNEA